MSGVYLRKYRVIWSICELRSRIYGCDLYFMTFRGARAGYKGNGEKGGTFQYNVSTWFLLYTLFSFYLSLSPPASLSLHPWSLTRYLSSHMPHHPHPQTPRSTQCVCVCVYKSVCVLTHNPRQFLLLFRGISSESNYITGEGGLNSF